VSGRTVCVYCGRPAFTAGMASPLCEPHFDLWLIVGHLKRTSIPLTVEHIQKELKAKLENGAPLTLTVEEVPELFQQLLPEIYPEKKQTHTAAIVAA
jgi:hypothetical protein